MNALPKIDQSADANDLDLISEWHQDKAEHSSDKQVRERHERIAYRLNREAANRRSAA